MAAQWQSDLLGPGRRWPATSGWAGWQYYQRTQVCAGQLYDELQNAIAAKDTAKVMRAAGDMQSRFGGTAYAQMSALAAAKVAFDVNDLKTAKTQLQWVAEHGTEEYKAIASCAWPASCLTKAYDEALKALASAAAPQFAGAVADRKGDVLVAQNKLADARTAYLAALAATDKNNPGYQLIQVKLKRSRHGAGRQGQGRQGLLPDRHIDGTAAACPPPASPLQVQEKGWITLMRVTEKLVAASLLVLMAGCSSWNPFASKDPKVEPAKRRRANRASPCAMCEVSDRVGVYAFDACAGWQQPVRGQRRWRAGAPRCGHGP